MQTFGRIFSFIWIAIIWLVLGVRIVLELIGYATLPEDTVVAGERYKPLFLWLLDVPWWALLSVALVSTLFLMWVSWPGAKLPTFKRSDKYARLAVDSWYLSQRLRVQERDFNSSLRQRDMNLPHDLRAFYVELERAGFSIPTAAFRLGNEKLWYATNAYYLESIRPFLSRKNIQIARETASEAAKHFEREFPASQSPQGTGAETQP